MAYVWPTSYKDEVGHTYAICPLTCVSFRLIQPRTPTFLTVRTAISGVRPDGAERANFGQPPNTLLVASRHFPSLPVASRQSTLIPWIPFGGGLDGVRNQECVAKTVRTPTASPRLGPRVEISVTRATT